MRSACMRTVCLAAICAVLGLICAGSANAVQITEFSAQPSLTQAGGHPDIRISYAGENRGNRPTTDPCQCNEPKDIRVSLPTGFIGNPHATPRCKAADFARLQCPADSQVGVVTVAVQINPVFLVREIDAPVYSMVPRPNQAGLLGAVLSPAFFAIPLYTSVEARTGSDYGLDAITEGIERQFIVHEFSYELWGVPADDSHTPLRARPAPSPGFFILNTPSSSPHIPFLINPGTCNEASSSVVTVLGYDQSVATASDPWPTSTGCDQLTFNPSQSARPTTTGTDSASGVDVDLTVPQLLSPTFPSPSEIRTTSLTLPVGFSVNPNAADGKTSCSDAMASFGTTREAHCPEFSKIGTDVIDSPALPAPIEGGIYLGDPQPGNRYRIFLTADGFATHVKLAGAAQLDPQTGQVVTTFEDLPQSPLTEFKLHFFGAERGLLATPTQCGTYAVQSTFVPWDELLPSQSSTQFFSLDSGPGGAPCPGSVRGFNPRFSAASLRNLAGAHSPFDINLKRDDGDQNLSGLTVTTPPGFSATLAGIPYCPDASLAAAASPSYSGTGEQLSSACPAASQIGTSITGAGAGTHPVYLPGKVYLAGPYQGAPLSLAVITPAVSGPYDLGNVVVRAALHINPETAQVTTVSDPLPKIFEGVPLRLRSIRVNLVRDNFALNPTNCDQFAVKSEITGDQGTVATPSANFQVASCASLPFGPELSLKLTGGVNRRGHPAIHATLKTNPGEANPRSISVTLPPEELLDNAHIGTVCTKPQFAQGACPARSLVGYAEAASPLLGQPLKGPVFLRSSTHHLPDLAIDLHGQIPITVVGQVNTVNESLRTTFPTTPDVPVGRFTLNFLGGKKGLVQNSESVCGSKNKAAVSMAGQNGKSLKYSVTLQAPCGKAAKSKRRVDRARSAGR